MINNKETIIDFYTSADGPTVMINVQEVEWLNWFCDLLIQLNSGELKNFDLISERVIKGENISQITIRKGKEHYFSQLKETKNKKVAGFIWTINDEKIEDILECCNNLITEDSPGHYYFYEDNLVTLLFEYKEWIPQRAN